VPYITYALIVVVAVVHLLVSKKPRTKLRVAEVFLFYQLVLGVALGGTIAFMGHVFAADSIADSIGWTRGSPFQFEVGMADLAFGVLGWMCIWRRGSFWRATVVGWSIFLLGDGIEHFRLMVEEGNYAINNAGMIAPDIVMAVLLTGNLIAFEVLKKREKSTAGAAVEAAAAAE